MINQTKLKMFLYIPTALHGSEYEKFIISQLKKRYEIYASSDKKIQADFAKYKQDNPNKNPTQFFVDLCSTLDGLYFVTFPDKIKLEGSRKLKNRVAPEVVKIVKSFWARDVNRRIWQVEIAVIDNSYAFLTYDFVPMWCGNKFTFLTQSETDALNKAILEANS